MRIDRTFQKPRREGVYLHIYNHAITTDAYSYPFSDWEKNKFIEIAHRYLQKYNIEIISLVVMGNHYHMLVYCHPETLSDEQCCLAYQKFHKRKKPVKAVHSEVQRLKKHSNNFSEYFREIQRHFSYWFNHSRPYKRRGALWQDRFQSQLIESEAYILTCLLYIEMNPVRANICHDPAQYPYSSFGRWQDKHPYHESFFKHLQKLTDKKFTNEEIKAYLNSKIKQIVMIDKIKELRKEGDFETVERLQVMLKEERLNLPQLIVTFTHQDWVTGKFIGSNEYKRQKYREWKMYRSTA